MRAGTMGLKGNLTTGEIVEQLAFACQFTKIRNVVFMGMVRTGGAHPTACPRLFDRSNSRM